MFMNIVHMFELMPKLEETCACKNIDFCNNPVTKQVGFLFYSSVISASMLQEQQALHNVLE